MKNFYSYIIGKIEKDNPMHAKKLAGSLSGFDDSYRQKFELFFHRYEQMLLKQNSTLNKAIEDYLRFCSDMMYEQINFIQTGKYSNTSFEEVNRNVYNKPEVMNYHMHGLLVSQFLWAHHYATFRFFSKLVLKYASSAKNIMEVGGGHGLYTNEILSQFKPPFSYSMVDISESSIALSKSFVDNNLIKYYLQDIYTFLPAEKFDFIVMGEVLEHVEDPISLMQKLHELGTADAIAFISTPCNAPSIDHIYLFRNSEEVKNVFSAAGWEVIEDIEVYSETKKVSKKPIPIPMMYAAFIKKIK